MAATIVSPTLVSITSDGFVVPSSEVPSDTSVNGKWAASSLSYTYSELPYESSANLSTDNLQFMITKETPAYIIKSDNKCKQWHTFTTMKDVTGHSLDRYVTLYDILNAFETFKKRWYKSSEVSKTSLEYINNILIDGFKASVSVEYMLYPVDRFVDNDDISMFRYPPLMYNYNEFNRAKYNTVFQYGRANLYYEFTELLNPFLYTLYQGKSIGYSSVTNANKIITQRTPKYMLLWVIAIPSYNLTKSTTAITTPTEVSIQLAKRLAYSCSHLYALLEKNVVFGMGVSRVSQYLGPAPGNVDVFTPTFKFAPSNWQNCSQTMYESDYKVTITLYKPAGSYIKTLNITDDWGGLGISSGGNCTGLGYSDTTSFTLTVTINNFAVWRRDLSCVFPNILMPAEAYGAEVYRFCKSKITATLNDNSTTDFNYYFLCYSNATGEFAGG